MKTRLTFVAIVAMSFALPSLLMGQQESETAQAAAELDQSAFCIVIEYAPSTEFISPSAANTALLAFSRVTHIELRRGQLSEQAIRMHKHLNEMAAKRKSDFHDEPANKFSSGDKESFFESARSIDDELRLNENIEWIEQLFDKIGDGKDRTDHDRRVFLKTELDRLGLYETFENKFLDLFGENSN